MILSLSTTKDLFLIGRAIRDKAMDAEGICSMAARQPLVAVTFSPEFVVSAGADRQQAVMDGSEVTVFHLVFLTT